jgi:hypothetical protein
MSRPSALAAPAAHAAPASPSGLAALAILAGQTVRVLVGLAALAVFTVLLLLAATAHAQQPSIRVAPVEQPSGPPPVKTPADYILLTVMLRHDQSKNLDEINRLQEESGFWAKFPPEGIVVESWYIVMGVGYIVTLRVPPDRLREVNRSLEQTAWKAFRTEFYPTYDARDIAREQRAKAQAK